MVGTVVTTVVAGLLTAVLSGWFGLEDGDPAAGATAATTATTPAEDQVVSTDASLQQAEEDVVPIHASVSYPRDVCSTFVVPGPLSAYGPAPEPPELGAWVREREGASANQFGDGRGTGMVLLTLTGQGQRPVTITDISFSTDLQKTTPLTGTLVENACGSPTVARYAEVDLDASPPQITRSSAVEAPLEDYGTAPLVFPYEVTSSENENLLLIASTTGHVAWTVRVSWSNGMDSGVLEIDDDGRPFRTALPAEGIPAAIPAGGGEWMTF